MSDSFPLISSPALDAINEVIHGFRNFYANQWAAHDSKDPIIYIITHDSSLVDFYQSVMDGDTVHPMITLHL